MSETIFAVSSGSPPAAIAVIRISGPGAGGALEALGGAIPRPRRAVLRSLRAADGELLDQALVLWLPGPASATGEDCAELHCHGGRAVVAAVRAELATVPGLREAEPGEFTRRAFSNGRIDLAQAEALGDLLAAETELQRRVAQAGIGGALSTIVEGWRERVLMLSALVEAALDFSDEDDAEILPETFFAKLAEVRTEILDTLARPRAERLRDGIRVVIAGPPNVGKSSLFNALVGDGAAIVSAIAGTTRDVIERPMAFDGVPFVLVDTAGLREDGGDAVEALGIARAQAQLLHADIVLWLGPEETGPPRAIEIQARSDDPSAARKLTPHYVVSSRTGAGLKLLEDGLVQRARELLPKAGASAVNKRQAALLNEAAQALLQTSNDHLLMAEALRAARNAFDRLLGHSGVENMLDSLFSRFCIGK